MCTATAQESATASDANAERQEYYATAGVTPKINCKYVNKSE
jgi:hypothetical protein